MIGRVLLPAPVEECDNGLMSASEGTSASGTGEAGGKKSLDSMLPDIYGQLRQVARKHFAGERCDITLQPTALVHEAYLRLQRRGASFDAGERTRFLAIASVEMRRILVDQARRRGALKRGGDRQVLTLCEDACGPLTAQATPVDVLDLHGAIAKLAELDTRAARVVELRFFGGLSVDEVAAIVGVSSRTIREDWSTARAWLETELEAE